MQANPSRRIRCSDRHRFRSPARITLALTAAILLVQFPATVWATDWYVDIANCPGPGNGSQANPFCRIQYAITVAQNGDTIHISPGRYVENLTIDKDLTIEGKKAAVKEKLQA